MTSCGRYAGPSRREYRRCPRSRSRRARRPGGSRLGSEEDRVLLTHDVTTMTRHALERIARGQCMPGVIAVHQRLPIGAVVDDLVLVASCSFPGDWVRVA